MDYICKCKSEISNICNADEGYCLQAMKIVHHHANSCFDWLISSGHQSFNPSREAISILFWEIQNIYIWSSRPLGFGPHDPFLDQIIFLALFQFMEMLFASLTSLNLSNNWLQKLDRVNQPLTGCNFVTSLIGTIKMSIYFLFFKEASNDWSYITFTAVTKYKRRVSSKLL